MMIYDAYNPFSTHQSVSILLITAICDIILAVNIEVGRYFLVMTGLATCLL